MGQYKRQSIAAREPTAAATLADMLNEGLSVFCWCNRCGHNAALDPLLLAKAVGRLFPVPELGTRMRCSRCQARDITTRPAWPAYGGGQMTRHL